ncbi:hypothetical protein [Frigidibacter sp. ROC022]|uniref:hypothetical protein n=1 Tax=Frigidibacter sp. ROC022 TaxID=2971796 RepID=UPI00215B4215|nr:hypothetical protein [Frigidibacter sp. ROC022]MCR8723965.1 hypothetical protein [Frigidibacter sp. ROC022]
MALSTSLPTTAKVGDRLRRNLDAFFAGIGQGFNAYLESRSRMPQIERLNAMSDAELAELGIAREDIARYVFRDLFHT